MFHTPSGFINDTLSSYGTGSIKCSINNLDCMGKLYSPTSFDVTMWDSLHLVKRYMESILNSNGINQRRMLQLLEFHFCIACYNSLVSPGTFQIVEKFFEKLDRRIQCCPLVFFQALAVLA